MDEANRLLDAVKRAGIPPAPEHEFDLATNRPLGPPTSWADEWGDDEDYAPRPDM